MSPKQLQIDMLHSFEFYPEEREVFRIKEQMLASQWAEENREVTIGAHVGPWRNDISPHAVFIMDTFSQPWVREGTICAAPQTCKTEIVYNCMGNEISSSPCPVIIVMPSQADARKVSEDRIIPMLKQSKGIKEFISSNPDDTAKQRIKLSNGTIIYMAWSNSPSALATFPARIIIFDEKDKFPMQVKREADPSSLGGKRVRTYPHTYKIFNISTPTREDGPIWQDLQNSDVIYNYFACCPECKHGQSFNIDQLIYPSDRTPEDVKREKLANYSCYECGVLWTDMDKNIAIRTGQWKPIKGMDITRPIAPGFHIPAWVSLDVSLSEIASAHKKSKGNKIKMIDFHNDYLAEPFVDFVDGEGLDFEILYEKRRKDYAPLGENKMPIWDIPMPGCVLTCAVDVQKNRLEAEVVAWGEGFESWGIEHRVFIGNPKTEYGDAGSPWNDLHKFIYEKKWKHESGAVMKISITGVDSGNDTQFVYKFTAPRLARRVYAVKGVNTLGAPLKQTKLPGRGKRRMDRMGATLIDVGGEVAKGTIMSWLNMDDEGPGHMHYHKGYSLDYFKQLTSEVLVKGHDKQGRVFYRWTKKHKDAPNEALDLRVYNYVMIETLDPDFEILLANLKTEEKEDDGNTEKKESTTKKQIKKGNGWVDKYKS